MDSFPLYGWAKTGSLDNAVTDSAAASTAIATGRKTKNGFVSLTPDKKRLNTILEEAKILGKSVGLVTNVPITHATPAAVAAHVSDRHMTTEIARQMIEETEVDVLIGGGENDFFPKDAAGCFPKPGKRIDGKDLVFVAVSKGYTYLCNPDELANVDLAGTTRLLGLFADEEINQVGKPSLAEMAKIAITILSKDEDGFFLMVEGGQIDWAGHENNGVELISQVVAFDEAVEMVKAVLNPISNQTLLIITTDHETGGMKVLDSSIGSEINANGPFPILGGGEFYIQWSTTEHTSANVPVFMNEPPPSRLKHTFDNTFIYKIMYEGFSNY